MSEYKPLEGVRVVELGNQVAAASCCRMLADWGADVVKLEQIGKPDTMRGWPAGMRVPAEEDFNPIFDNLNANKRAISVDMFHDAGREAAYKLLESADIFVSNLRTKALQKSGFDWETLHAKFPKLIMAQLNGYGEKGEEADRPGYDTSAFWARSGFLYCQAIKGDYPVYIPMGVGDVITSLGILFNVMAALDARNRTGEGDYVMASLYGTAIWTLAIPMVASQYHDGKVQFPVTRESGSPFGTPYKCSDDKWFLPQVVNFARDHQTYYKVLGLDNLVGDPIFEDRAKIVGPINEQLIHMCEEQFAKKTSREWMQIFTEHDLAGEIMYGYEDVLNDPQAQVNEFVYDMNYPNGSSAKLIRSALRSRECGLPDFNPGPMVGQNTAEILAELGYSEDEIAAMEESDAVQQHA